MSPRSLRTFFARPSLRPSVQPIGSSFVQKELREIERDRESGVRVDLKGNSLRHMIGYVQGGCCPVMVLRRWLRGRFHLKQRPTTCPGPQDTPYQGGLFKVDILLGKRLLLLTTLYIVICRNSKPSRRQSCFLLAEPQYPFVPPKMRFLTKVW